MRTIKNILYLVSCSIISAALLVSCNGFLDREPTDSSNAGTAIATTADAQVALNGIMREMTSSDYYGRDFMIYADAKGGDLTVYSQGRGLDTFYSFNHSATSNSYSEFWEEIYSCLMQVNNLIENIDRLEGKGVTGFNDYKAQALTLRALFYFDLVRLYGLPYNYKKDSYGVPLITTTLDASAKPGRATVAEVYSQIINDLTQGAGLYSKKSALKNFPGYYANIALQARVKMFMDDYDGALSAAKEVIDSKVYTLYTPAKWAASWTAKNGSESIFELGMDAESDRGSRSLGFYYMKTGIVSSAMGWFLASDYFLSRLGEDPTDVRWAVMGEDEGSTAAAPRKGACYKYVGSPALIGDGGDTYTAVNIKVIRLSEMYLIAAEASLHSKTPDKSAAAGYLNAIRCRAPRMAAATAATVSDQMILDERSKEFFGEGQRFFDMIRMNQTITFNDDYQNLPVTARPKSIDRTFGKIVLPISQDEINVNSTIASQQNEAYK